MALYSKLGSLLSLSNRLAGGVERQMISSIGIYRFAHFDRKENHLHLLQITEIAVGTVPQIRNSSTSFFNKGSILIKTVLSALIIVLACLQIIGWLRFPCVITVSADQLWKGVTSVSNAGKKRGRGKGVGKKTAKDLNRGQIIGVGKSNIVWPGLTVPILQGKEIVERKQLPPDPDRDAKLIKLRDNMGQFRPLRLSPLERGWSGTKMHGRSIGPPDPIGQDTFEGFDTKVLEMKTVTNMDANMGRVRRFSVIAFTGNGQGLCGFALAKSPEGRGALRKAKNRAGQKLLYIEMYNKHTVLHDFFSRFGQTKVYVHKKPEGFGLVCHRAIRTICQLIGIKDIYAKIEGPTNLGHIVKAFMIGLLRQKSHQDLAEEKSLFLVEQREENGNFPVVVAAPSRCRSEKEIRYEETLDFSQVCFGNRIPLRRRLYQPFFKKLPSWENHLMKTEWRRNHNEVKRYLLAEYGYGSVKGHLAEKYPESSDNYSLLLWKKQKAESEEAEE